MSLTKAQANTNAQAALSTIQTAADSLFTTGADSAIANAISFGQFRTTVTTFQGVNIPTVANYYMSLGYAVTFPDFQSSLPPNQAQLFGFQLDAFFTNPANLANLHNPVRMTIDWS